MRANALKESGGGCHWYNCACESMTWLHSMRQKRAKLQQSCSHLAAAMLSTSRYQDVLRQLVGDKSVASCQQTCCKLIAETCYPQACCKLLQQVVTSLILTDFLQLDEINKFVATCQVDR